MSIYLFTLIASFIFNFSLIIPFINLLYKLKLRRVPQVTRDLFNKLTPIFDRFHRKKAGTPVGGGILLVVTTVILFLSFLFLFFLFKVPIVSNYQSIVSEVKILLFTFFSFALLGLYDDLRKIFFWQEDYFFGLRFRHKFVIQTLLALLISFWIFKELKVDIVNVPFFGVYNLSFFYIFFAAFVIVAFANAVNISDGLDGLATGILLISLLAFWVISRSILDTPLSIFIAIWLGGLIAFLYFNIYPARLFMGDSGALSSGATLAVIGLLVGKNFALPIIGGIFVIEIFTSLVQLLGKKFLARKVFPVAPFHLWLQLRGWEEPKIVMRLWTISIMFAVFGLMIAFMK